MTNNPSNNSQKVLRENFGEQGWSSDTALARVDVICGSRSLLVVFSNPRGFSKDVAIFPSSQKLTCQNSKTIWKKALISLR